MIRDGQLQHYAPEHPDEDDVFHRHPQQFDPGEALRGGERVDRFADLAKRDPWRVPRSG